MFFRLLLSAVCVAKAVLSLPLAFATDSPIPVAENLVLLTIDGLRPEEFFGGADRRLFLEDLGVKDAKQAEQEYIRDTYEESRKALMPFMWKMIESGGWAAGDWRLDSKVEVTNGRYFSYPGYQEILCGFPDHAIDSNDKKYNTNQTVLEWLNQQPGFAESVMAFASWDVFPFIINDRRSGIPVNAGWQDLQFGDRSAVDAYNFVANNMFHEWDSVRFDAFTAAGAVQAMRTCQPRVLYVALGEPDDWAHAGRYDRYLLTARLCDRLIGDLWAEAQSIEKYAGKTVFLVTTDHGRGDGREGWKNHSDSLPGSERIWVAAFGPGLCRRGVDRGGAFQQAQVAATAAALLGLDYRAENPRAAKPLPVISGCE